MSGPAAEPTQTRPYGWAIWLVASVAVIALAALLRYDPPGPVRVSFVGWALPEACSARRWLGVPCPGCGLTRSFILAAHGRFSEAFQMHPFGTLAFLLLVAQVPLRILQGLRSGRPALERDGNRAESAGPASGEGAAVLIVISLLGIGTVLWWAACFLR